MTIIEREKSVCKAKNGSSIYVLFSGVDHDWEGHCVSLDGVYNSLFAAQTAANIPIDKWQNMLNGKFIAVGGTDHIGWAYCIIECKIGDICDIGMAYDQLFE